MSNPIRQLNEYFSDESKWCKGGLAKNFEGKSMFPFNPILREWTPAEDISSCCLVGGLILTTKDRDLMISDEGNGKEIIDILYASLDEKFYERSYYYNRRRYALVHFNNDAETTFPVFKAFLNRAEALWDKQHPEERPTDISVFTGFSKTKELV